MGIRTLWGSNRRSVAGLALLLLLPPSLGCREAAVPSLGAALLAKGNGSERARAFIRVALEGRGVDRRRAAFLWGLQACELGSPRAAVGAFRIAAPVGGRGVLAARRLTGALERAAAGLDLWQAAAGSPWLGVRERTELLLRGAETFAARHEHVAARACVESIGLTSGPERGRALAVLARTGDSKALLDLALDYPAMFEAQPQLLPLPGVTSSFSAPQWRRHAAAWLAAGNPRRALAAARRAGKAAALEAARASLRLRNAAEALQWARQSEQRDASRFLIEAEANRQLAWGAPEAARRSYFAAAVRAAETALKLSREKSDQGAARLLAAEGLSEVGRFVEAAAHLADAATQEQARFEWVWRRTVFLQATTSTREIAETLSNLGRTARGRRVARFWRAAGQRGAVREDELHALADSGTHDLPALWAAARLGITLRALDIRNERLTTVAPPLWARDILALGRTGDVVLAWRADLERAGAPSPAWLGLLDLAALPPLDAIPLLIRGEPRLATGQWGGLPRSLLEAYLPLPFRAEVERAAARGPVPPWVLAALVRQESAWAPRAVSPAGAVGLAQVLPATANELMRRHRDVFSGSAGLYDPVTNLTAGAMLLARWQKAFRGSWTAGLAAYNAGERRVRTIWERSGRQDGPEFVEALEIPETWDYVHRVVMLAEGYRALYWPDGRGYPWT